MEQEGLIIFIPDQPKQLFAFPNGIVVLDNLLFQLKLLPLQYNDDICIMDSNERQENNHMVIIV